MGKLPSLIIIEDERAFAHVEQTEISLRNRNDNQKDCELLLLIDKTSTLDYKFLRVSIDDKVIKLSDLETIEDQDNYYFILDNKNIYTVGMNYNTHIYIEIEYLFYATTTYF